LHCRSPVIHRANVRSINPFTELIFIGSLVVIFIVIKQVVEESSVDQTWLIASYRIANNMRGVEHWHPCLAPGVLPLCLS